MLAKIKKILFFCALFLVVDAVQAIEAVRGNPHVANAGNPLSFSYAMQILISFLAVIGFILLLAWLMKKTGRYGAGNNQTLKIISSMSLGMREKILLIEVEEVRLVVGVAPGQITTLHVLGKNVNAGNDGAKPHKDDGRFSQFLAKFTKQ